jgi:hypothetical protein
MSRKTKKKVLKIFWKYIYLTKLEIFWEFSKYWLKFWIIDIEKVALLQRISCAPFGLKPISFHMCYVKRFIKMRLICSLIQINIAIFIIFIIIYKLYTESVRQKEIKVESDLKFSETTKSM